MSHSKALEHRLALLSPEKLALFKERLRGKSHSAEAANPTDSTAIPRRPAGTEPPLSLAQERLWWFAQRHPGSVLHNLHHAIGLAGELDVAALEHALHQVVQRHEALRTRFPATVDGPVAIVSMTAALPWKHVDLRAIDEARHHQDMMQRLEVEGQRPFDLAHGPLFRALLFTQSNHRHLLILLAHHLILDGWSLGLLLRELATLYTTLSSGTPSPLPEPTVHHGDFAAWQRANLGAIHQRHLASWRQRLAGCPRQTTFPSDKPPPTGRHRSAAGHQAALPGHLAQALEDLARHHRATLFMVLLTAFAILLHRRSGREDLVLGTPTAGRSHASLEGLLGLVTNLLVLRLDLGGNPTFVELLARVRTTTLEAYDHQEMPFESLLTALDENLGTDLVRVTFNLPPREQGADPAITAGGVVFKPLFTHDVGTEFDLSLYAVPGPDGLGLHFAYDPDLFTAQQITSLAEELHQLLETIITAPQRRLSEV